MITSFQNPLVKRIRKLRQKKWRVREQACFVEGVRPVGAAIEAGWDVEALIWCELLTSEYGLRLVQGHGNAVKVSVEVFRGIAERENPVGLGGIVRTEIGRLDRPKARSLKNTEGLTTEAQREQRKIFVGLVGVGDAGNLGTIVRTVDAAVGSDGVVILIGDTVDPFHPAVIKASMGAVFCVDMVRGESDEVIAWARDNKVRIVATSARGAADFRDAVYGEHVLLLMGSEREGLSAGMLEAADERVFVPMAGVSSSLNLAVATGILLYEIASHGKV